MKQDFEIDNSESFKKLTVVYSYERGDVLAFDRTFDGNRLRVRELFSVINEQIKMNATDNVVVADFSRANALAA